MQIASSPMGIWLVPSLAVGRFVSVNVRLKANGPYRRVWLKVVSLCGGMIRAQYECGLGEYELDRGAEVILAPEQIQGVSVQLPGSH